MEKQEKMIVSSIIEILEKLQTDLEKEEEPLLGAENLDEAIAFNRGIYTALSKIEETIAKLSDTDSENYVNYHYRNCTIHIDRGKFMERRPEKNDIDRWICTWYLQNTAGSDTEDPPVPDPDELANMYSVGQIEHIVSHYLDIEMEDCEYYWKKYTQKKEEFDEDAFRKQCEDAANRMLKGQAGPDDFPETDTGEKLRILAEVLYPSEEDELKKYGVEVRPVSLEERIERSKKKFWDNL
ncbi:MAG: hypothetical protein K6D90_09210 [Lachnospiraceae bacterium]|nr:hypothetical protein [Lachnospiraceae bacterium]